MAKKPAFMTKGEDRKQDAAMEKKLEKKMMGKKPEKGKKKK